jgi:hypothetical protein
MVPDLRNFLDSHGRRTPGMPDVRLGRFDENAKKYVICGISAAQPVQDG